MSRRNIELMLLVIAAPLVILLFAMMALNAGSELDLRTLGVPLGIFCAFIVAHLSVRKFAPSADPALLPIAFALSGTGIAFVTRLAPELASRQVMWLFMGVVFMVLVLALLRNPDKLSKYKYTLMIVGVVLLLSPMLPFLGQEIYGSRIWLSLGGFSFQPGEVAKIFIVIFLASYLATNRELLSVFTWRVGPFRLPDFSALLPLLIMWALSLIIVIFEKDLGSALVFFFVFITMLYVATGKKFYVFVALGLAALAAVFLYAAFTHVQIRVLTWLNPFADAQGVGYQLVQATYSLADGGLFGVGIGRGLSDQIPVVESDFIFAAIGEEAGLLGAAGILLLFLCLAIRGFVTAARAKSDVSSLMAVGFTTTIVLQAFIIVGGVTRLIPLTGLTLPFISQGGSSLLASFIALGFLLRCGDEGTGVHTEMATTSTSLHSDSVLGRVAIGKRLTNGMLVFSVLFALLVANLTYTMVVKAEYYQNMPGNNHTIMREAKTARGTISTSDGLLLAQSVQNEDGTYSRNYPAGTLASHVIGYASQRYGTAGIESSYNDTLRGQQNFASWSDVIKAFAGVRTSGNDIVLTLDSTIQSAAQDALYGYRGACIVMDPETGAILAMASSPTYEANDFESVISGEGGYEDTTLLNRATQGLYAPGSTFKIVSLTTALSEGVASEDTTFDSPGTMEIGGNQVTNFNETDHGTISLSRATEVSSNTAFGQLGVQMGSEMLVKGAEKFGFNKNLDFALPLYISLMPDPREMTEWETAWAAAGEPVGQHKSPAGPQATVLEMALVGSAIANDGVIMTPYLVDSIYNSEGEKTLMAPNLRWVTACDAETAQRVRSVLEGVVAQGTGTPAAVPGTTVAGKTGTAEKADGNDSWFVGMAGDPGNQVVIAIILEDINEGDSAAAHSQNVLRTALQVKGVL